MFFRKPSSRMVMVLLYGCQAVLDNPAANAASALHNKTTLLKALNFWKHINPVLSTYLNARPNDEKARSYYARIACELHHWNTANLEFSQLGDHARVTAFGGRKAYLRLKAQASQHSGQ
ncbi:MAG: hypothetical protein HKL96_05265 [Phycisphaerales bacterium]|nr:hypothetical protein [Phycisphaerales bacterium]